MDMITLISWLPFIGTILAIVLGEIFGRRKDNADISQKLGEASDKLSELYENRIKMLEDELILLRPLPARVQFLSAGIDVLLNQMRRKGVVPDWTPNSGVTVVTRGNGR